MLRRSLLTAGAALLAAPALPRFAEAAAADERQVLHILDRLAFGPTQADAAHVKSLGIERYIAEQLQPESLPEPPMLGEKLAGLTTQRMNPVQLFVEYGPLRAEGGVKPDPDAQKARRRRANIIAMEARAARVWRALYSPRQLHEVLVDFWFNHFNVFAGKGLDHLWVGAFENDAIRPHAFGKFRDLLLATAHHPAMLFYLDNFQNVVAGLKAQDGRELGINENYARELMELHTLGVDGGYTQDDVIALARILTGWSLPRRGAMPRDMSGFEFYPPRHDNGTKRLLGRELTAAGELEGVEALSMLAGMPATAKHITGKLAQYFVADTPPAPLVDSLAARFQQTDGDIRSVLQTLFASREFHDSAGKKYKSPYRYVLSAARAAGVQVKNPRPLLGQMARQGQPLYGCVTPDGFKDTESAWLSPDATMLRVSFATALSAGRLPLGSAPIRGEGPVIEAAAQPQVQTQMQMQARAAQGPEPPGPQSPPVDGAGLGTLLAPALSAETRTAVASAPPGLRAALILGSPDFMRR